MFHVFAKGPSPCYCMLGDVALPIASAVCCRATPWDRRLSRRGSRSAQWGWRSRSRGPVPNFRMARNRNRDSRVMLLDRAPSACLEEQDS